jgi:hypothetical protein
MLALLTSCAEFRGNSQEDQQTVPTKVLIKTNGLTVAFVNLKLSPKLRLSLDAQKAIHDEKKGSTNFKGDVRIQVFAEGKAIIAISADEAELTR